MEDEYKYTALSDDTVAFESPTAESRLLNLDMHTEVLDECESAQNSGDQMEDFCDKDVVLDSDDEGGDQNEAVNLVNGECFPVIERFSGRDELLKRQPVRAGYFRRLDNKVSKHVFLNLDSARSDRCDEESNAGRACFYSDSKFQEHRAVMDSVQSRSTDQKLIPTNAEEFHLDSEYRNMVRESLTEYSLDERKLSSHESKSMDMGKDANYDCECAELNYVESPEAAESHDKALDFVDHYLSVSDLGSYKDIETRRTNRIKSPPSLRSKGSQSLPRRVNLGCTASKFDWAEKQIEKDEYTSLRMNKDSIFGFEGEKSGYLFVNQESDSVNLQNDISNLQSKEKLPGNIISTNYLDTDSLNSNDIDKIGSNSGICIAYDSMELDEQFDAGVSRQNVGKGEQLRLTPDALDIGLDTQMAAEAMDALIHAGPPMFDACFAHQGSDNKLLDSSNTVNKKSISKHVANPEEAFIGWRCKEKRSKCVKISTVQEKNVFCSAAKRFKNQRGTVAQLLPSKNLMTEKLMNRKALNSSGNTRNSKCGGPPGITALKEKYGFTKRDSLKEFQKVHCLYDRRSKETTDGIKSDSPPKQRKMISFHDHVSKLGVRGTCLKLSSDSSFEVKTDTAKREENSNLDVADRTLSKLNLWIYPKRKRTRQCAPRHPIRSSNQCSPCAAIESNVEKYPIVNEESQDRVARLLVYTRRRKSSLEREQIGSSLKLAGDFSSSVNDNAVSDRQVQISIGFDTAKPSMRCDKLDDEKPSSIVASGNMKSDVLSNGHCMTLPVFEGSNKSKQPFNHLSRSPLMKELMRLGYTESLPDFLPKDSRRRRAMETVCILFSQNLETSIIKQQRKIVARLGFSIASCCSDATHFVTDRFVRTRNMLESIAFGKPVVTHLWLENCEQAGYVIEEKSYILRDEKKEKEIGFKMPVSLTRASQHPLLKDRRVLITPNVKPGIDVINGLVKAVHGQAVQSMLNANTKDKVIPDDLLILSCEEDYTICLPFLEKGASIYNSELLLNGIVTQKLEYERYKLFKDFTENGPSSMLRRRNGDMACATHR
ncbi:hypothetical protein Pfo_006219 [Paulownia fortunei]|nr:hypothetical protein Pfo_006219 [Paulownia fortunei]